MAQWPSLLGTEGVGGEQGGERVHKGITFTQSLPFWVQMLGLSRLQFTRAAGKKEDTGVWTGVTQVHTGQPSSAQIGCLALVRNVLV